MKNRTLSMIGFFIDSLHIKTVSMAAALHVDASLISKWKSGKRVLTDKSMYFDDVIAYFLEQNRDLADDLTRHPNMRVAFVSETDGIALPAINCWCRQNQWMVQMDRAGFRFSNEMEIIAAASMVLEECLPKIPPVRKDPQSVQTFLLELAAALEQ